jgi:phage shock protein C
MRALRAFRLDRRNGKILGVCAGIANQTGWDPTFVRVGMVLIMLAGPFPWTLAAYLLVGLCARQLAAGETCERRRKLPEAKDEVRDEMRETERRRADVESYSAAANGSLAREIESLR